MFIEDNKLPEDVVRKRYSDSGSSSAQACGLHLLRTSSRDYHFASALNPVQELLACNCRRLHDRSRLVRSRLAASKTWPVGTTGTGKKRGRRVGVAYNHVGVVRLSDQYGAAQVVDHTGLTGRYDFTLTWLSSGPDEQHVGAISSDDPDKLSHWNFAALGLKIVQVKIPTEDLVIDHIESPSQN